MTDSSHLAAPGSTRTSGDAAPNAPSAEGSGRVLGFMYIAKRTCGRVSAACWDDPAYPKDTAKFVSDQIKRGLVIERLERREGDAQPDWICSECRGKPCQPQPIAQSGDGSPLRTIDGQMNKEELSNE